MASRFDRLIVSAKIIGGSLLFCLSFNLFLLPNSLNAGGLTGISMILAHLLRWKSVGLFTVIMNIPLFALAGMRIGKRFFLRSFFGMILCSMFLDIFASVPPAPVEPFVAAIYGGILCGLGLGLVFTAGGSTGGSDILVRLMKRKCRNVPLGVLMITFDLVVAVLSGVVFGDLSRIFYSGIAIYLSGKVIDASVCRFDYSRIAWIICEDHIAVASSIAHELGRGATFIYGEGSYQQIPIKVVLTAVRRQQVVQLKRIISELDPNAFIILQEAHQVLGDGFLRYNCELF